MKIDLNCDMGESFGIYQLGLDEEVIQYITSANIACGWHAGDPLVMRRTVQMAKDNGVSIGAHPGFPDLLGFGRRNMDCTPEEIRDSMTYQIGALQAFAKAAGTQVDHVKAHGALYLMACSDERIAEAVAEAIAGVDPDLIWVVLGGTKGNVLDEVGRRAGLRVAFEGFPDRAYAPEGTLVSRRQSGAVIKDPEIVAERAFMMAKGKVIAVDGKEMPLRVHTLCVHGDTPGAVKLVKGIREKLTAEEVEIVPTKRIL